MFCHVPVMISAKPHSFLGEAPLMAAPVVSEARKATTARGFAPPIAMLGVPFDNVTIDQTISLIEEMLHSRQPHYLATANVDFLVQALRDVELRRILMDAHLVLCDGTPLLWASRLLGNPLPERVAGSDLVPLLLRIAAQKQYRVYFLGGTEEATKKAVENLGRQHPNLQISGHYSPPFSRLLEMDHEAIRNRIQAAAPDFLFVSFGCPKQEKWISMHYRSLGVPVSVGVGATIDFLAGTAKRAPRWMRRTGLEWIHRMLQEPRRLGKRYVDDLWWFGRAIARQWWSMQFVSRARRAVRGEPAIRGEETLKRIKLPARVDLETVKTDGLRCEQALSESRVCLLDLSGVRFIDSTGMGMLIRLQKRARLASRHLILLSPSEEILTALRLMRLTEMFVRARDISEARAKIAAADGASGVRAQPCYFPGKPSLFWEGEVTAANAEAVWAVTQRGISEKPDARKEFIIDLSRLDFIDSTGVGLMVRAKKLAADHGVKVVFTKAGTNVRSVLRLTNLDEVLLGPRP
jgi:N-acetylglucosaminyldiphosphoundecaprenol N-acetyl-beta-D-mannosaminyltransferase